MPTCQLQILTLSHLWDDLRHASASFSFLTLWLCSHLSWTPTSKSLQSPTIQSQSVLTNFPSVYYSPLSTDSSQPHELFSMQEGVCVGSFKPLVYLRQFILTHCDFSYAKLYGIPTISCWNVLFYGQDVWKDKTTKIWNWRRQPRFKK